MPSTRRLLKPQKRLLLTPFSKRTPQLGATGTLCMHCLSNVPLKYCAATAESRWLINPRGGIMERMVRDVMHVGVITCPTSTTLGELTRQLVEYSVHAVFVEDERGTIIGVISDIDLLTGEWLFTDEESLRVLKSVTAGDLMSSPATSVEADVAVQQAAVRMADQHLHRLLVTEAGKPIGVISVSDIVRSLGNQEVILRTVEEVMSRAIVVCRLETPLAAVARGMNERRSRSVIVVESSGAPKGVVTGLDLMRFVGENGFEQKIDRKSTRLN